MVLGEAGIAKRRTQQNSVELGNNIELDYRPVKAGPALYDSYHDFALADVRMSIHARVEVLARVVAVHRAKVLDPDDGIEFF